MNAVSNTEREPLSHDGATGQARGLTRAYSAVGFLLLAELALQFYFIATAAMHVWGSNDNAHDVYSGFKNGDTFAALHALNGTFVIPATILVLIALSFAARLPARMKGQTAGLLAMMVVQFLLPWLSGSGNNFLVAVSGLHGLLAMAIVGLAVSLVFRSVRLTRGVA